MATDEDFTDDKIFKIIVIGDDAADKTLLIKRFTQRSFIKDYIKTLGAQLYRYDRILEIKDTKVRVRLFFWDISGQSEFKFMHPTYYNGSKGGIAVFDLTKRETFYNINEWLDDVTNYVGKLPFVLVGNNSDLVESRCISYVEAKELARQRDMQYMECSTKTGDGVGDIITILTLLMMNEEIDDENERFA